MKIEQIFSKQLTRDINGVVKAEQTDNESVFVELDEYVVTKELGRHFRAFFDVYVPAVTDHSAASAGKIGVWVSGFFGSGKSHFIKILSYLLENKQLENDGQTFKAIDFFKEKIKDPILLANIQSVVTKNNDVILFNIDSRADTGERENAILKVFLKVFNERVGYCADFPHIAHLERELDKRGVYQKFKDKFSELTGCSWQDERDACDFYRDELSESLAHASGQSLESARQSIEKLEENFPLSILNFSKWVNQYLDREGDKTLLFMVDEVGQFIGKNTQMMLKLQTITEDLGMYCKGRAWVVVTSQAEIDTVIGGMDKRDGDDFSKIQGRFTTKLQLSSSNTSEVIQKRLLEKKEQASRDLGEVFEQKGDILRNQLAFDSSTTASLKGYHDSPSFVDNFPFIPYHYPLLQKVFESIRTKGATGKHLAMGERSLLDAFQSAAKQIKDHDLNSMIPFYRFYEPIESFLEPVVKRTIDQACEQASLTNSDNQILKTLFLIRYVDTVKSTLDNLVTLSIEHIDTDKIALKKQLEESLNRLERERLIARNGEEFIFLTNEEKEIENEIRKTDVESSELSHKLSGIIFDDVLQRKAVYRYPFNKQDFRVSRFCNGHPKDGVKLEDLVVKVVSPLDPHYERFVNEQQCINYTLEGDGCVLVRLGENQRLWEDLSIYLKTDRFLKQKSGQRPEQEHLLREKQTENLEREKRMRNDFEVLFAEADIYAIGAKRPKKSSTPSAILEDAYKYVIENAFSKLDLLTPTAGEITHELKAVLTADDMTERGLDPGSEECNRQASREVEQFITLKIEQDKPVFLRDALDRFSHRPYGWPDNEMLLLLARLGIAGKISFTFQGHPLALKNAYDSFQSVRKWDEIRIQKIYQHDEKKLNKAARLAQQIFSITFTGSDEKSLYEILGNELRRWDEKLKSFSSKSQTGKYPGQNEINNGLVLIATLLRASNSYTLIQRFVDQGTALEKFSETFEDLDDFYNNQFKTWQKLALALNVQFTANKHALGKKPEAAAALKQLEDIYRMSEPYAQLRHIDPLVEKVAKINEELVEQTKKNAIEVVELRIGQVQRALANVSAPAELQNKALYKLQQCKKRIESTLSIPQMISDQSEAGDVLEEEAYEAINAFVEKMRWKQQQSQRAPQGRPEEEKAPNLGTKQQATYKRTITLAPSALSNEIIETEQQVESYLDKLRKELLNAVKAGDRVRIK